MGNAFMGWLLISSMYVIYSYVMQSDHAYIMLRHRAQGTGNPVRIQEILRKEKYIEILDENLKESAEKL